MVVLALSVAGLVLLAGPHGEGGEATTARAVLAPPGEILRSLKSDDPERRVRGFVRWHTWRASLSDEDKRLANRFLGAEAWVGVLADEVLYDMESRRRRLSAYKLLNRVGGQRVFPYFVWSIEEAVDTGQSHPALGFFKNMLHLPSYVRWFFLKKGDPTVLEHLPATADWLRVRSRIGRRWRDRAAPECRWKPLQVEAFEDDLSAPSPARRRLAIRALTTHGRYGGIRASGRYRDLLTDADPSVRLTAIRSLAVRACPEARGLLKRMVEDERASTETRRAALRAVVNCGTARDWTVEWMIENLPDWPEALDPEVRACLVSLRPGRREDRRGYTDFVRKMADRAEADRTRRVVLAALKEMED